MADVWGLEVVKGREIGREYPVGPGRHVLGNAINGEPGIDLSTQEGASPRRMAGRQAVVEATAEGLSLRDLESPGGTFVNRQRLLADRPRPLEAGDIVQVGSVQLKVVKRAGRPPATAQKAADATSTKPLSETKPTVAARPSPGLPAPFVLAGGAGCRSWDDFLTVSAQQWKGLCDEVTSGRIDAYLRTIGRDDLRPDPKIASPDERLDAWLGRLPTLKTPAPELDVHPTTVRVRAVPGGGVTRARFTVTNTGYRLLRTNLRIEPTEAGWVKILPPAGSGPFVTSETTDVGLEVEIPETLTAPKNTWIEVSSNGGTARVEVRLEPQVRADADAPPDGAAALAGNIDLSGWLARMPVPQRVAGGVALGAIGRLLIGLGDRFGGWLGFENAITPGLAGPALVGVILGGLLGRRFATRRGGAGDGIPGAFAGAFAGLLAATVGVAGCRAIEPLFAGLVANTLVASILWAGLGALLAVASAWRFPHVETPKTEGAP